MRANIIIDLHANVLERNIMRIGLSLRLLILTVPMIMALLAGCGRSSPSSRVLVIRINEVMASNTRFTDIEPNGIALDWVELYNPNGIAVRLEGYSLSDDPSRSKKYRFPSNLEIPAGGFLVILLVGDGELDRIQAQRARDGLPPAVITDRHADFGVSASSDTVYLFADGRQVDRLGLRNLPDNATVGRYPDGDGEIGQIFAATPGEPNYPPSSIAPVFSVGGTPRLQICTAPDDEPSVLFKVLADPTIDMPTVRLRILPRQECRPEDQTPERCEQLFAEAGDLAREVDVLQVGEVTLCQTVFDDFGNPVDVADSDCPAETTNGSWGSAELAFLSYQAFLPPGREFGQTEGEDGDMLPTVLLYFEIEDALGRVELCACYVFGGGCFDVKISEYQPVNDRIQFVCENCQNNRAPRSPDWVEIVNLDDETMDISQFGLVGRGAALRNPRAWLFGENTGFDPDYLSLDPGERVIVLADGDSRNFLGEPKVFRRVIGQSEDGLPILDESCKYYSAKFALNADRATPDGFALTAPAAPGSQIQVVIDEAVLDFRVFFAKHPPVFPETDPNASVRGLSVVRTPDLDTPGSPVPRDCLLLEQISEWCVTLCPSPAGCSGSGSGENRLDCAQSLRVLRELAVVPVRGGSGVPGGRCTGLDEGAVVSTWAEVDNDTIARVEDGLEPSLAAELEFSNALGDVFTLTLGDGISVVRDEDRQSEARPGTVLVRFEAEIPPQPEGVVNILRFEIRDEFLISQGETEGGLQLVDSISEQTLIDEDLARQLVADPGLDPADVVGHSSVSFRYVSGTPPLPPRGLIHEVVPQNESTILPDFQSFVGGQSPSYIELHLPADADVEAVDLSGFFVGVEPGQNAPLIHARRKRLPDGTPLLVRGGFLLLVLGPLPPRDLSVPTVSVAASVATGAVELGLDSDPCESRVYLVAPDELGNCVVDSLAWDCAPDDGAQFVTDMAFGRSCEDPAETVRVTPTPGAANTLVPEIISARHVSLQPNDTRPNPCDLGPVVKLAAVVGIDRALHARSPSRADAFSQAGFTVFEGTLSGSPIFFDRPDLDTDDRVAIEFTQTLLLGAATGVIGYGVDVSDACGGSLESCSEDFCFSLQADGGDPPELFVNEINRRSVLPGGDDLGSAWIELYNPTSNAVELEGMSITYDARRPRLHMFGAGDVVAPGATLLLVTYGGVGQLTEPSPLEGDDAPDHRIIELDWVPRRPILNSMGMEVGARCGFDEAHPEDSAPPAEIYLIDRVESGSCLVDSFVEQFPDPGCSSSLGLGRVPDGGDISVVESPTPGSLVGDPDLTFVRGDVDADEKVTLTDAVGILEFLFRGVDGVACLDRLDADDSGRLNVSDVVYILGFLFRGEEAPPPPFPDPGDDPTVDDLPCD